VKPNRRKHQVCATFLSLAMVIALASPMLGAPLGPFNTSVQSQDAVQRLQARISRETYHELVMLPQLSIFDHLSFKVDGANVVLMGQVRNAVLKDDAERSVKKIEGVESVKNEIEILPPSPNDDRIRRQVARAIFRDDRLFRYSLSSVPSIHIIVKGGHVTLMGSADSQGDKDRAGLRANGVPGVFSVKNELEVTTSAEKKK
jgi:osmotically-inducible protein OsmY